MLHLQDRPPTDTLGPAVEPGDTLSLPISEVLVDDSGATTTVGRLCDRDGADLGPAALTLGRRGGPRPLETFSRPAQLTHDPLRKLFFVRGQRLHLKPLQYSLLHYLATHPDRLLAHEAIRLAVWGRDFVGEDSGLTTAIHRLRKQLDAVGAAGLIASDAHRGYVFVSEPDPSSSPRPPDRPGPGSGADRYAGL